jgi:hypothetical protein
MKKYLVLFLLCLFSYSLFSQRISLKSTVYDAITYYPIAGVNVFNLSTKSYAFTDSKGTCYIMAQVGDTLILSKSIYRQEMVIVVEREIKAKAAEYLLYFKAIILQEVKVYALNPDYEKFKREIISSQLPKYYEDVLKNSQLTEEQKAEATPNQNGLLKYAPSYITSPITALYNKFSKKEKTKRLYYEMNAYEDELADFPKKYSREIVSDLTGLKDDDLVDFMMYCQFSYYDLIRWNKREIEEKVKAKFIDYEWYKLMYDGKDKKK